MMSMPYILISSLADLYDETVMSPELRKAHQLNDRGVRVRGCAR